VRLLASGAAEAAAHHNHGKPAAPREFAGRPEVAARRHLFALLRLERLAVRDHGDREASADSSFLGDQRLETERLALDVDGEERFLDEKLLLGGSGGCGKAEENDEEQKPGWHQGTGDGGLP
jgi:hypothetical protein